MYDIPDPESTNARVVIPFTEGHNREIPFLCELGFQRNLQFEIQSHISMCGVSHHTKHMCIYSDNCWLSVHHWHS